MKEFLDSNFPRYEAAQLYGDFFIIEDVISSREGSWESIPPLDLVASSLSQIRGRTLAIEYDDQVGHKVARLFEDGKQTAEYGEKDEVWALLDDEGEMILSQFFPASVVVNNDDEEVEYDCYKNGIAVGLERFGGLDYGVLFSFMTR